MLLHALDNQSSSISSTRRTRPATDHSSDPAGDQTGAPRMTRNSNELEQAVSRTLRDSLEKLQRTSGELDQAVGDLVAACASSRVSNSLPPMLRARTAAASLAASL